MLKRFSIVDDNIGRAGILTYDTDTQLYSIDITDEIPMRLMPLILHELKAKGITHLDDRLARVFIKERIIPPERQNIGTILRDIGAPYYDEIFFIENMGLRNVMDDFYMVKMEGI